MSFREQKSQICTSPCTAQAGLWSPPTQSSAAETHHAPCPSSPRLPTQSITNAISGTEGLICIIHCHSSPAIPMHVLLNSLFQLYGSHSSNSLWTSASLPTIWFLTWCSHPVPSMGAFHHSDGTLPFHILDTQVFQPHVSAGAVLVSRDPPQSQTQGTRLLTYS